MDEAEREHWRGKVDAMLGTARNDIQILFRNQNALEKTDSRLELLINTLTGDVASLALKIGLFATIGAFAGAAIVQYIISAITK